MNKKKIIITASIIALLLIIILFINLLKNPQKEIIEYLQSIEFVNEDTTNLYSKQISNNTIEQHNKNIENNIATADDYLIKANCLLALKDDDQANYEVMNLIKLAKEIQPTNINIYKAEILAELRLKNYISARDKLEEYKIYLDQIDLALPEIKNETMWQNHYNFTFHEREWVEKMLIKINSMCMGAKGAV